ncbi:hypothetical protein BV20DRAFT_1121145 [Pilatotrama ljubarskyi]|nr:hypothetical protein BV20DRAFT_1121145 [Pilatotrama ljubarskyi]
MDSFAPLTNADDIPVAKRIELWDVLADEHTKAEIEHSSEEAQRMAVLSYYNQQHEPNTRWALPMSEVESLTSPGGSWPVCSDEEMRIMASSVKEISQTAEEYTRVKDFLAEHPHAVEPVITGPDAHPPLIEVPPIPAPFRVVDRHYFYGWTVPAEWLDLLTNVVYNIDPPERHYPNIAGGIIRERSRFKWMIWTHAVHPYAPDWTGDDQPDSIPEFLVLTCCDTTRALRYYDRPTQAQFNWLKDLLPGKPQWFRNTNTKVRWEEARVWPDWGSWVY